MSVRRRHSRLRLKLQSDDEQQQRNADFGDALNRFGLAE